MRRWHRPPRCSITLDQIPCIILRPLWVGHVGLRTKGWRPKRPCFPSLPVTHLGNLCSPSLSSGFCGFRHPRFQREDTSASGHSKSPLNYKLQLPLWHFRLLVSGAQQARRGVSILARATDLGHQKAVTSGDKEEYGDT